MKKLTYILLTLLVLSACTDRQEYAAMRHGLDSINERNRNDEAFSATDVQPYIDYFDRHGEPNDRLLAYYLLGRAYHEQGEAPMALQCYQQAIECADTLSADCDFAQLSRVYGQMGEVFYYQGLFHEQLDVLNTSINYAWKGKDTLAAIMNYETLSQTYQKLSMSDSMQTVSENAYKLYTQYGYYDYAASSLGNSFRVLIKNKEFQKTKEYMHIYETKSGFFDSLGTIEHGREIYYNIKGYYYIGIGKNDSAEYFFRKELHDGKDFNNQNAGAFGLAELFTLLHRPDSAAKYYQYAYAMNDSMYAQMTTSEVERMQAMYDYTRYQETARKAEQKAEQERAIWQWGGSITIIVFLIVAYIVKGIRNERRNAQLKYEHSKVIIARIENDIEQAKKEILVLKTTQNSAVQELITEKEKQIASLSAELNLARQKNMKTDLENNLSEAEENVKLNDEYQTLLSNIYKGKDVTEADWKLMVQLVQNYFPESFTFIMSKRYMLSNEEYLACILIRLHIMPSAISRIINKSEGSITNIRVRLLKKLFDIDGKAKEFDQKLWMIC